MKSLQAESYSPLYHQLMQRIRGDIDRGTYPTGSRIPPEHELEQLYQVSRVTVRRALAEMPEAFDPIKYLAEGRKAVQARVQELIRLLGSSGKA